MPTQCFDRLCLSNSRRKSPRLRAAPTKINAKRVSCDSGVTVGLAFCEPEPRLVYRSTWT